MSGRQVISWSSSWPPCPGPAPSTEWLSSSGEWLPQLTQFACGVQGVKTTHTSKAVMSSGVSGWPSALQWPATSPGASVRRTPTALLWRDTWSIASLIFECTGFLWWILLSQSAGVYWSQKPLVLGKVLQGPLACLPSSSCLFLTSAILSPEMVHKGSSAWSFLSRCGASRAACDPCDDRFASNDPGACGDPVVGDSSVTNVQGFSHWLLWGYLWLALLVPQEILHQVCVLRIDINTGGYQMLIF